MSMYSDSVRAFLKPILPLLDDPEITEIMINSPDEIWIERRGQLARTDARFSDEGLLAAARNIAQYVGRVLSDERPQLDARLPDGSRIHVVLSPVARRGPVICIRKFFKDKLDMERLVELGAATPALSRLIEAVVQLKLNTIIAGGSGSGKTTLLNVISQFIPLDERIVTIEDSAELQLQQPHIVPFESRPPDKHGRGAVTLGDLLNSALRLRPDRVLVGEVRGGEAFYLLQAMNTGVGGSMSTAHANTPIDALRRLETLSLMSSVDLPMVAVRAQVASALNVIVCCARLADGSRKVTHVSEVLPLNDDGDYRTQDLFVYTVTGKDENGNLLGYHAPTGILPSFMTRLATHGFSDLDEAFFDPATYGVRPPASSHGAGEHRTRWAPSLRHREDGLPDPEPSNEELKEYRKNEMRAVVAPTPSTQSTPPPKPVVDAAPMVESDEEALLISLVEDSASEPAPEVEPTPLASQAATQRPRPPPPVDEPSIQIAADVLDEVGRVVKNQSTFIHRNPLLSPQPSAPQVGQGPRVRVPGSAQPRRIVDEETDPHIRMPPRK